GGKTQWHVNPPPFTGGSAKSSPVHGGGGPCEAWWRGHAPRRSRHATLIQKMPYYTTMAAPPPSRKPSLPSRRGHWRSGRCRGFWLAEQYCSRIIISRTAGFDERDNMTCHLDGGG